MKDRTGQGERRGLKSGGNAAERAGRILLLIGILVFTFACAHRMNSLYESGKTRRRQDLASINQAVWNTSRGHLLHATILRVGMRDHLEPALIFYGLNYLAGGTIQSLMIIHAFLISLGAIPLYLLARRRDLGVAEALLLPGAYFLLPPLHQMMKSAFLRPELLFFPALTLMAYAVVFSDRRWLLVSVLLALFCKESGAFTVLGLGLYLMIAERRWKLGAALSLLGALWVPMVSLVLLPGVSGMEVGHMTRIRPYSLDRLKGLYGMRWPAVAAGLTVFLLILRRWAVTIALPHLAGLLFFVTRLRYVIPVVPIPWFLTMDVLAGWRRVGLRRLVLAALPILMIVSNIRLGHWERLEPDPQIAAAVPLIELIPAEAGVATQNRLLVHLSSRARLYEFNRRHRPRDNGRDYLDADYFLLSRRIKKMPHRSMRRHRGGKAAWRELEELDLVVVGEAYPWKLYRKRDSNPG